jgi:hypothetical protein
VHNSLTSFITKTFLSFQSSVPVWISLDHVEIKDNILLGSLASDFTVSMWNVEARRCAWSFNVFEKIGGLILI